MHRRSFMKSMACTSSSLFTEKLMSLTEPRVPIVVPIIDTHIHLFDPRRSGGVPWPEPSDAALYKPALPARYEGVIQGTGVVGAIAIEASPLRSDNDWLLAVAARNPIIVGVIGDLIPGSPEFAGDLERLGRNSLFRGIRYGNLWNRDLARDMQKPGFLDGVKKLSEAGLVFESANPDPPLIRSLASLATRFPDLTIVIDHIPHAVIPSDHPSREAYLHDLKELGSAPRVFAKLSEVLTSSQGRVQEDPGAYRATLDLMWQTFGENKLLFGSDWPNSDHVAAYGPVLRVVDQYMRDKGPEIRAKIFWQNSAGAYHWKARTAGQPTLGSLLSHGTSDRGQVPNGSRSCR